MNKYTIWCYRLDTWERLFLTFESLAPELVGTVVSHKGVNYRVEEVQLSRRKVYVVPVYN